VSPRFVGPFGGHLLIQTSLGSVVHTVRGHGITNPYGVKSIVWRSKVPAGVTVSEPISLFNPHSDEVLNVTEIFASEGIFDLSLPKTYGESSRPASLWQVSPLSSKQLVTLTFKSDEAGEHSGVVSS